MYKSYIQIQMNMNVGMVIKFYRRIKSGLTAIKQGYVGGNNQLNKKSDCDWPQTVKFLKFVEFNWLCDFVQGVWLSRNWLISLVMWLTRSYINGVGEEWEAIRDHLLSA